jgi:SAM-dependent methyltransferase
MQPTFWSVLRRRWRDTRSRRSLMATIREIAADCWEFLRESTPERKRLRYGDMEYDWDHAVDTTSATISHRGRLMAALSGAPYQPTEPALFREMLDSLQIEYPQFTFIDLGSGKGRTLLIASEFPFRHIIGVELLPELHAVAEQNIAKFTEQVRGCKELKSICLDARDFEFPDGALLLYLFNPLLPAALAEVLDRLRKSLEQNPRNTIVIYHNPLSENVLAECGFLHKTSGTHQYSIYSN